MDDVPMKMTWLGKDVDEMTREELIEAIKILGRLYNDVLERHTTSNRMRRFG